MDSVRMTIELRQMKFYAYHGVLPQETQVGNHFVVSLSMEVSCVRSITTDQLDDTINYAEVYDCIAEQMARPSKLLEHVAGRIVGALLERFADIEGVEVCLSKLNPPFRGDVAEAVVKLSARRATK